MNKRTLLKYLRAVKKLLRDAESWRQEMYHTTREDGTQCYCLDGAINKVVTGHAVPTGRQPPEVDVVRMAILNRRGNSDLAESDVLNWNDKATRKHADVIKKLDAAILRVSSASTSEK